MNERDDNDDNDDADNDDADDNDDVCVCRGWMSGSHIRTH